MLPANPWRQSGRCHLHVSLYRLRLSQLNDVISLWPSASWPLLFPREVRWWSHRCALNAPTYLKAGAVPLRRVVQSESHICAALLSAPKADEGRYSDLVWGPLEERTSWAEPRQGPAVRAASSHFSSFSCSLQRALGDLAHGGPGCDK